jgi:hypothetical protein
MMDITVLDRDFNVVGIHDTFKSLIWKERYYGPGDFELYTPLTEAAYLIFVEGNYLRLKGNPKWMIIEDVQTESSVEEGDYLIVTGRDLTSILDRRCIGWDTNLSGTLESRIRVQILKQYFYEPNYEPRHIPNFECDISDDPDLTSITVSRLNEPGELVLDVITDLCTECKAGFEIYMGEGNIFRYRTYLGKDRSYSQIINPHVVFSGKFENLLGSSYSVSTRNYVSVVYIRNASGNWIQYQRDGVDQSALDRVEIYVDGNTNDSDQLQQIADETFSEYDIHEEFVGEADTIGQFQYGVHFGMGDIVQIEDKYGKEGRVRVTELATVIDEQGWRTFPTFEKEEDE